MAKRLPNNPDAAAAYGLGAMHALSLIEAFSASALAAQVNEMDLSQVPGLDWDNLLK